LRRRNAEEDGNDKEEENVINKIIMEGGEGE